MPPEIILALVGTSALVVIVFMREILGPFLESNRNVKAGHEPSKTPAYNIGKLFSVINDFRSDVMDALLHSQQKQVELHLHIARLETMLVENRAIHDAANQKNR